MSLDDLTTAKQPSTDTSEPVRASHRSLAWLLPVTLLLGFITIFGLLFGNKLIPATEVLTAPVITIRAAEQETAKELPTSEKTVASDKGSLLFQASGWVEPDPYTVYVPALVNGVLDKVMVLEGQTVKKGELLATLIDDDAKLSLLEATQNHSAMEKRIRAHCSGIPIVNADIEAAKLKIRALELKVEESADNYNRFKNLSAGSVSRQQVVIARLANEGAQAKLDEALAELPRLKAQLEQIDAERISMEAMLASLSTQRDTAQLALNRTQITSPMDGIVLRLHAAPGRKKMLDMDDPNSAVVAELYDPSKLQARIDVPLNEAAALAVGQHVEMSSDLLADKVFTAKVTRISGQADLQRNTLQAKVSIENPDPRLRPDMLVRAKFYSAGKQNTGDSQSLPLADSSSRLSIYVSNEALVTDTQVWVVSKDSTAEIRRVTLGEDIRDGHRIVLDGLRSGESVILPPFSDLVPGLRIKPLKSKP